MSQVSPLPLRRFNLLFAQIIFGILALDFCFRLYDYFFIKLEISSLTVTLGLFSFVLFVSLFFIRKNLRIIIIPLSLFFIFDLFRISQNLKDLLFLIFEIKDPIQIIYFIFFYEITDAFLFMAHIVIIFWSLRLANKKLAALFILSYLVVSIIFLAYNISTGNFHMNQEHFTMVIYKIVWLGILALVTSEKKG